MSVQEQVQKILDDACAEKGKSVPGMVFGMMNREGKWLAKAAAGVRDLKNPEQAMTTDSVFAIYSCTKMLAAIAVMHLVESGKLDLDEPAEKYLPEIKEMKMLDGSEPKHRITTRMLLAHTAGFSYTFFSEDIAKYCKEKGLNEFEPGRWEDYRTPLIAQPGEEWNYGVNLDWAGRVLEAITGKTLGEYSKEHIFDPVGCKDLAYKSMFKEAALGRMVSLHQRGTDDAVKPRDHFPGTQFDSAGAGCLGTLEDYLKCIIIMINEGKAANGAQILKPDTVEEMWKDQLEGSPAAETVYRPIPGTRPDLSYPVESDPAMKKGWAISASLTKVPWPTGRSSGSIWWAGLPNLYWMADRKKGVVNMILTQTFPFNDPRTLMPWLAAEKAVYDSLEETTKKDSLDTAATAEALEEKFEKTKL